MSSLEEFGGLSPYQRFLRQHFHNDDETLANLQEEAEAAGLPAISIGPEQGKFLQLLVQLTDARNVLEVGTLGGYSATWIGRALPEDGRLISLEIDSKHASFARRHWEKLGLDDKLEVRVGPAAETLPTLADDAPFDLIFLDADKEGYVTYLEWAVKYSHPGTVILADNIALGGRLVNPEHQENSAVVAMQRFVQSISDDPRLESTVLPYTDGLAMAVVR